MSTDPIDELGLHSHISEDHSSAAHSEEHSSARGEFLSPSVTISSCRALQRSHRHRMKSRDNNSIPVCRSKRACSLARIASSVFRRYLDQAPVSATERQRTTAVRSCRRTCRRDALEPTQVCRLPPNHRRYAAAQPFTTHGVSVLLFPGERSMHIDAGQSHCIGCATDA